MNCQTCGSQNLYNTWASAEGILRQIIFKKISLSTVGTKTNVFVFICCSALRQKKIQ